MESIGVATTTKPCADTTDTATAAAPSCYFTDTTKPCEDTTDTTHTPPTTATPSCYSTDTASLEEERRAGETLCLRSSS